MLPVPGCETHIFRNKSLFLQWCPFFVGGYSEFTIILQEMAPSATTMCRLRQITGTERSKLGPSCRPPRRHPAAHPAASPARSTIRMQTMVCSNSYLLKVAQ